MSELRQYQQDAVTFLYEHDHALVLAPVGAGKTAIALTAMRELIRDGVITQWLVVAPLRVCNQVWAQEAAKWAPELTIAIATGNSTQRTKALASNAHIVVINFDNLSWLAANTTMLFARGLVIDELTKLKNSSGQRFKDFYKVISRFHIRWGLTGSFTSNGVADIFGQCKIIDDSYLGKYKTHFEQRYFTRGFTEWDIEPRPGALQQIMQIIKPMTYMLQPGVYVNDLPQLNVVPVTVTPLVCMTRKYKELTQTRVLLNDTNDADVIAGSAAVLVQKLQQLACGFYYVDAMDSGTRAVWFDTTKFDRLDEILEENQHAPTIIFYNYIAEFISLRTRYPNAAFLDGSARDDDVIQRWNRGELELLILHPQSAGHGLNLQHGGSRMIFTSPLWSAELWQQCIGRLHRSGQREDVYVYVLMSSGTVDERIFNEVLPGKLALADLAKEYLNEIK